MRTILLSFESTWFEQLEKGETKYEYRKVLPKEESCKVYFYVSTPVKAITGFAVFGQPELLSEWHTKFAERPKCVHDRISEYEQDCKYAVPILQFTPTNRIPLTALQSELSKFVVPRMYYYIDDSELYTYLQTHLTPLSETRINDFNHILDSEICV